jgi:aspartyl-tRNA(Asn)/glutamyl-tRNA(Gln) amidotransferase subunit B
MKNVNTFSGAMLAIEYEAERQINILSNGGEVRQETRRWDEAAGVSVLMRSKEDAADYRYFWDADLPHVIVDEAWTNRVRAGLPELPVARYERFIGLGLNGKDAAFLVDAPKKAEFFDECIKLGDAQPKAVANWIIGEMTARLNKVSAEIGEAPVKPDDIVRIVKMIGDGIVNYDAGKVILDEMFASGGSPEGIVDRLGLAQNSDEEKLKALVRGVLEGNAKSVDDYRGGKANAYTFLVGQCMKASKGKANPQIINKLLKEFLETC